MSCEFESNGSSDDPEIPADIAALQAQVAALQAQANATDAALALAVSQVVANFHFAGMPTENLTTGPHTLTSEEGISIPWESFQQGTTFDILNGVGWRFRANATSTTFPATPVASRTAAVMSFLWNDFYDAAGLDATSDYLIKLFCTRLDLPTTQSGAMIAGLQLLWIRPLNTPHGASSDNTAGVNRHNAAGAQALRTFIGASGSNNYTNPLPNAFAPALTNVLAMALGDAGMHGYAGDWNPAAQTWDQVLTKRDLQLHAANTTSTIFKDRGHRIGAAFPTGNTNADMAVDVERMVIYKTG